MELAFLPPIKGEMQEVLRSSLSYNWMETYGFPLLLKEGGRGWLGILLKAGIFNIRIDQCSKKLKSPGKAESQTVFWNSLKTRIME
jgi:hypothetical protein